MIELIVSMLVENVYGYNDELLVAGVCRSGAPVVDVFCIIINNNIDDKLSIENEMVRTMMC